MGRAEDVVFAREKQAAIELQERLQARHERRLALMPELIAKCQEFLALLEEKGFPLQSRPTIEWKGERLFTWNLYKYSEADGLYGLYKVSLLSNGQLIEEMHVKDTYTRPYELRAFPESLNDPRRLGNSYFPGSIKQAMELIDREINKLHRL